MMAGIKTNNGPSWARQKMNITTVSKVAAGMPEMANPIPPRIDCTNAVTTTPNATARIACPASNTAASPLVEARRTAKWRIAMPTCSPRAYSRALNNNISEQWIRKRPICAAWVTNQVAVWPK
ncbi:hypothetical protein D3C80_1325080 [compost metagenome]